MLKNQGGNCCRLLEKGGEYGKEVEWLLLLPVIQ